MVGLPDGEKNFEDNYNRLGTIPVCDRRTDILPRHSPRYAYAWRGKNFDDMLSRFHLIPERNGQTDLLYEYRASVR